MKNRRDDEMDVERGRQSSNRDSKRKRSDSPDSPEPRKQSKEQPSGKPSEDGSGGLREMGVDEMNSLRAKLGLKPLSVGSDAKVKTEQPAEPSKVIDVEDKIAM